MKPTWDEYFMQAAALASTRSSCVRRKVGAVAVRQHRAIAGGYNGTPSGLRNCDEGGCPRCNRTGEGNGTNLGECWCSHAEENAISQCARMGIAAEGATIYTTSEPCLFCAKLMTQTGIVRVVYRDPYSEDHAGLALLRAANISCESFPVTRCDYKYDFCDGMRLLTCTLNEGHGGPHVSGDFVWGW